MFTDVEHGAIETFLERRSNIAMLVSYFVVWMARRDQMLGEVFAGSEVVFAFVASAIHTKKRDANGAILAEFDGLLKEGAETRGIAVGSEAHDFVFIGVEVESKMQGDDGIKNADRIA